MEEDCKVIKFHARDNCALNQDCQPCEGGGTLLFMSEHERTGDEPPNPDTSTPDAIKLLVDEIAALRNEVSARLDKTDKKVELCFSRVERCFMLLDREQFYPGAIASTLLGFRAEPSVNSYPPGTTKIVQRSRVILQAMNRNLDRGGLGAVGPTVLKYQLGQMQYQGIISVSFQDDKTVVQIDKSQTEKLGALRLEFDKMIKMFNPPAQQPPSSEQDASR